MKCQFTLFCFNIRVLQGPSIIWIQYLPGSLSQVDVVTISCRAVTGLSSIVGPGRQLPQILRQIRIIIDPQAGLEPGASPSQQKRRRQGSNQNVQDETVAALRLCYRCSCKFCDSKVYIVIIQVLSPCTPAAGLQLAPRQDSDSGAQLAMPVPQPATPQPWREPRQLEPVALADSDSGTVIMSHAMMEPLNHRSDDMIAL